MRLGGILTMTLSLVWETTWNVSSLDKVVVGEEYLQPETKSTITSIRKQVDVLRLQNELSIYFPLKTGAKRRYEKTSHKIK